MKKRVHYKMNSKRIRKLSKRIFSSNQYRNIVIIIVVALATFMLTSVFSIGFSYTETFQLQQIRMMGTTADVAINNPTESQVIDISDSDIVKNIGISQHLGQVEQLKDKELLLGINWIDENEWKLHRLPTVSEVVGKYPVAENEIMVATWILNRLGIADPQEGMNITLSYHLDGENSVKKEDFILSGYYKDYSQARTGDKGSIYVSEKFKNKVALSTGSVIMVSFEDSENIQSKCDELRAKINFGQEQSFEIVPVTKTNNTVMIIGIICILFFIFISSYLLIYNILYINVVRDIRFYGQLRLIGFTSKEIKKIIHRQILLIAIIGIPIGLILGAIVSLGIVPYTLNMLYTGNEDLGMKVSFSPFIFGGAALFAFLTVRMGGVKPAKIAAQVSPISAMTYNDIDTKKLYKRKNKVFTVKRMAFQNIFRSKKSAVLVFSSLFLGLALYWVATALLSSISPENFIQQWGEADFVITYSTHDDGEPITTDMQKNIEKIDGVKSIKTTYAAKGQIPFYIQYDEEVFGNYIDSLEGKAGIDFSTPEKRKAYTDNFYGNVYGIEESYVEELNKTLDQPIDLNAFKNGEIVLLQKLVDKQGNLLIQPNQTITIKSAAENRTFKIAEGFLSEDFQSGRGDERGTAPDLYISKSALETLTPEIKIFRIAFDTDEGNEKDVLEQLNVITSSSENIQIISRIEKAEEMEGYLLTTKVLTIGLSIIFLLTGILNFITTMITSVNSRKQEFAILESIGMTHKQQKQILIFEGLFYWIISVILLLVLGNIIYIPLYFAFKQIVPYAAFQTPIISLIGALSVILLVCLITPYLAYRNGLRDRLVEPIVEK